MNTARAICLLIGLLLIADNVWSRTVYVINNNRGYNHLEGELNDNKPVKNFRCSLIDETINLQMDQKNKDILRLDGF